MKLLLLSLTLFLTSCGSNMKNSLASEKFGDLSDYVSEKSSMLGDKIGSPEESIKQNIESAKSQWGKPLEQFSGSNGSNGTDGINGLDGKNGLDGDDGMDGKNGTNGSNYTGHSTTKVITIDNSCVNSILGVSFKRHGNIISMYKLPNCYIKSDILIDIDALSTITIKGVTLTITTDDNESVLITVSF